MPRLRSRTNGALIFAALVVAIVGVCFGLLQKGRYSKPDVLAEAKSAYSSRAYDRAAEFARQRLRTVPNDAAALRILARATARLGRDSAANALFARLGSPALEAEDLYLLGVGLNRAGQRVNARTVWEKSLDLEPDRGETIDRLISLEIAESRISQAASLAERLAKIPGWELRGELMLGTLRSEMSDPAGTVSTIDRALARPQASQLDRSEITRYRELLARSHLKMGQPAIARALVAKILENGKRPEASWLLSRAALQEGAFADASQALNDAGSYRADHPLELEPAPYIGEAACARCHQDEARAAHASRHASTLVRGHALLALPFPTHAISDPDDPKISHAYRREGDQIQVETRVSDQVYRAVVEYAFGSPRQYFSLVGHDPDGRNYIFRLSHFKAADESGWVRTTGHTPDPRADHSFLGKPLDPVDGIYNCLFCHSTDPRGVLNRSGQAASDEAIGCERCHGPGGNHVRAIEAKFSDPAIISPVHAPAEGRLRLCGQCHSHHAQSALPRTDPFWLRFQGTTITWSRCYTESGGTFDCMTCHDPHHDRDRSPDRYNAQCLSCHSGAASRNDLKTSANNRPASPGQGASCPVDSATGCIGCHMPSIPSKPLHASFTDHYIRVRPETKLQPRR